MKPGITFQPTHPKRKWRRTQGSQRTDVADVEVVNWWSRSWHIPFWRRCFPGCGKGAKRWNPLQPHIEKLLSYNIYIYIYLSFRLQKYIYIYIFVIIYNLYRYNLLADVKQMKHLMYCDEGSSFSVLDCAVAKTEHMLQFRQKLEPSLVQKSFLGCTPDSPELLRELARICGRRPFWQLSEVKAPILLSRNILLDVSFDMRRQIFDSWCLSPKNKSTKNARGPHVFLIAGLLQQLSNSATARYVEIAVCMFDMTKFQRTCGSSGMLLTIEVPTSKKSQRTEVSPWMYCGCKFRFLKRRNYTKQLWFFFCQLFGYLVLLYIYSFFIFYWILKNNSKRA